MKLRAFHESGIWRVEVAGDVEGEGCNCLEHFWDHYVPDRLDRVTIDVGRATSMDDAAAASLTGLIVGHLAEGAHVVVVRPPAILVDALERHVAANSERLEVQSGNGNDAK